MITFESQEEFESAVIQVLIDHIDLQVHVGGSEFVKNVKVSLANRADYYGTLIEGQDSV